ncbi:MAG: histidine phosphatase family protein [Clostridia bacterium]|nr:histidine phosphatase family protein [Clostridia bacterium]
MRLIMVRHGEPDYEHDCLTPEGRRQAEAAAERLSSEGISEIFSSPNGRARETASFTAKRLGLPVTVLDYMHEISWGGPGIPENGHPWTLSEWMIARENFDFYASDWRKHPYFRSNEATVYFDRVSAAFDAFLEDRGYRHDGGRFLCTKQADETIALFSHGGSGACVLASLLRLPFPWVATVMPYDFTSIIILDFPSVPGEYVFPRLALFNDISHLHRSSLPQFQPDSE